MQILSSKGDIGVFRNIKQEVTVPTVSWFITLSSLIEKFIGITCYFGFMQEFNFRTEKRLQHNPPPTDLFSKVSLVGAILLDKFFTSYR